MTLVPVLLYHAVTARPPPGLERFTVAPRHFADHLRVLRDAGRVGLTVSQFAACLRNGPVLPELPVVVTFDDGYADFLDAAERLGIAGLPATLYMTTGQIGAARMLTRRQLQSLGGSVEVGAHSRTHPGWTSLPPAAPRRGPGSKADLEDLLQQPTRSFAYPHGDHDRQVRQTVVDAGFDSAAAVKNAFSHERDDPFAIARITVTAGTTAERIGQLLQGRGAPAAWARSGGGPGRTGPTGVRRRLRREVGQP